MTVTADSFRQNFPEFSDTTKYPDQQLDMWLCIGALMIGTGRWPTTPCPGGEISLFDFAVQLFMGHNLYLGAVSQQQAALGGAPGGQIGAIASLGANSAQISYDTQVGILKDAGHWNLSTYGIRLLQLALLIGAGPIQIGTPGCWPTWYWQICSVNAYPGPWTFLIPNPQL